MEAEADAVCVEINLGLPPTPVGNAEIPLTDALVSALDEKTPLAPILFAAFCIMLPISY